MRYRLVYEPGARALVRRLPPDLKPAIKRAIESLQHDPHVGKALRFELAGYRSLRSQRSRVIYRLRARERIVEIHYLGVRRDVYDLFRALIQG